MRKPIPATNTNKDLTNIDNAILYVFEDNEAVIKIIIEGRSPTLRHVSRTHRVALDWLFDRIHLDSTIQIRYIDTKHQLVDILIKGSFTRDGWNNLLHLFNISHFSSTCCAENSSLISCSNTMAKRMQEQKKWLKVYSTFCCELWTLVSMSVRDALHQLIADLHGDFLRVISAFVCLHWQGLGQAARALRKRNIIDGTQTKKLILLDGANNLSRHITVISLNQFRMSIRNSIKTLAATSRLDVIQTDTSTAPVDEYVALSPAASRAATASPSAPVPVIEHATPAPVDVCTAPVRMIEHVAPSPLVDYTAPLSAATGVVAFSRNRNFLVLLWNASR